MNHQHYQHYTKEEKDALIEELEEYRAEKETGARASNKVAAIDMRSTLKNIGIEVSWMYRFMIDSHLNTISSRILLSVQVARHLHLSRAAMSMTP